MDNNILNFIKKHKHDIIWVCLAIFLFTVDIVTKQLVLHTMKVGDSIDVIGSFIQIDYVINQGAAFGIQFKDGLINKIIMILVSIIGTIILVGIYVIKRKKLNNFQKAAIMVMTAGCVGNLIDRVFYTADYLGVDKSIYPYGGVVDFIGVNLFNFPRFNVADSCLVIGTIMLIVWLIIAEVKEIAAKKKTEPKSNEKILSKDEIERNKLNETTQDAEEEK